MPELPEVMRISESLNNHLSGKYLIKFSIGEGSRYTGKGFPGLELLTGLLLKNVQNYAKRIIFIFYDHINKRDIFLLSFLAMEGHWLQIPRKHSAICLHFGHFTKRFNVVEKIFYYDDVRHQGTLTVCTTPEEFQKYFKAIGPDYMKGNITYDMYKNKILNSRTAEKQICWWMMEQKFFSGIGNYLKSEILYRCRISPYRLLKNLNENDIQLLYYWSIQIIKESYLKGGLTIATYEDPDGNMGTYQPLVYKQKMDPHNNPIIKETLSDKRTTHWCPNMQT